MASVPTTDSQKPVSAVQAKEVDSILAMSTLADEFAQSMSGPKTFKPSDQARMLNQIYRLLKASGEDKERVVNAMVYLCLMHGASPNVDWTDIDLVPGGGCTSVSMGAVVDGIIGRKNLRKFMNTYGDRAPKFIKSSPYIRDALVERAVRSGTPITRIESVVDFGVQGMADPETAGYRVMAKTAAVKRANGVAENSLTSRAKNFIADTSDIQNDKLSNTSRKDRYGPL